AHGRSRSKVQVRRVVGYVCPGICADVVTLDGVAGPAAYLVDEAVEVGGGLPEAGRCEVGEAGVVSVSAGVVAPYGRGTATAYDVDKVAVGDHGRSVSSSG